MVLTKVVGLQGSIQTLVSALACPDTDPSCGKYSLCVMALQTAPIHIKTQHLRQLSDGVLGFWRAARVAVSNTSQMPSLVLAEHSK